MRNDMLLSAAEAAGFDIIITTGHGIPYQQNVRDRRIAIIFFFFNDTAPTEIYTLSLHDALPISPDDQHRLRLHHDHASVAEVDHQARSAEHTSELQSRPHLVCRPLLEKKKQ